MGGLTAAWNVARDRPKVKISVAVVDRTGPVDEGLFVYTVVNVGRRPVTLLRGGYCMTTPSSPLPGKIFGRKRPIGVFPADGLPFELTPGGSPFEWSVRRLEGEDARTAMFVDSYGKRHWAPSFEWKSR